MVTKEQLIQSITDRHYQFSMVSYIHPLGDSVELNQGFKTIRTACIAGFAVLLGRYELDTDHTEWQFDYSSLAEEALGLAYGEGQSLFNTHQWPAHLSNAYWEADAFHDTKLCAQIACEVIDMMLP